MDERYSVASGALVLYGLAGLFIYILQPTLGGLLITVTYQEAMGEVTACSENYVLITEESVHATYGSQVGVTQRFTHLRVT